VSRERNNWRFSMSFREDFEFSPQSPEQFFVRAMESGEPIYITDEFLTRVGSISPDELVDKIIADLHRDSAEEPTDPTLQWFYLFMDFREDFPRLMQLLSERTEHA